MWDVRGVYEAPMKHWANSTLTCQTKWGTWPRHMKPYHHVQVANVETHPPGLTWSNYGCISPCVIGVPWITWTNNHILLWKVIFKLRLLSVCVSKTSSDEDVSTTCTNKTLGNQPDDLPSIWPTRAQGTKIEEQEHELQNLNSAIAAKVQCGSQRASNELQRVARCRCFYPAGPEIITWAPGTCSACRMCHSASLFCIFDLATLAISSHQFVIWNHGSKFCRDLLIWYILSRCSADKTMRMTHHGEPSGGNQAVGNECYNML